MRTKNIEKFDGKKVIIKLTSKDKITGILHGPYCDYNYDIEWKHAFIRIELPKKRYIEIPIIAIMSISTKNTP